jgi:hypothetical protein
MRKWLMDREILTRISGIDANYWGDTRIARQNAKPFLAEKTSWRRHITQTIWFNPVGRCFDPTMLKFLSKGGVRWTQHSPVDKKAAEGKCFGRLAGHFRWFLDHQ